MINLAGFKGKYWQTIRDFYIKNLFVFTTLLRFLPNGELLVYSALARNTLVYKSALKSVSYWLLSLYNQPRNIQCYRTTSAFKRGSWILLSPRLVVEGQRAIYVFYIVSLWPSNRHRGRVSNVSAIKVQFGFQIYCSCTSFTHLCFC